MFEPNDLERLLLDDHFLGLALEEDGEDAGPRALARWVADIEAGRAELPPGWRLSRTGPGSVIWIAPSGERYVATLPKLSKSPARPGRPGRNRPASRRAGLVDRHISGAYLDDSGDEEDWLDPAERDYYFGGNPYDDEEYEDEEEYEDDSESVLEELARLAVDVEAGRAELWPGWKLDRSSPGMLVWTLPSGRRYASTLTGEPLPVPRPSPDSDQAS
jgi:hypothetical protein